MSCAALIAASASKCTWSPLMPPIDAALTQQVFATKQTMSLEMNSLTCSSSSPARLLKARMPLSTPLATSMAGEVAGTGRAEEGILSAVLLPSLPALLGAPGNLPSRLPILEAFSSCSYNPCLCCCPLRGFTMLLLVYQGSSSSSRLAPRSAAAAAREAG